VGKARGGADRHVAPEEGQPDLGRQRLVEKGLVDEAELEQRFVGKAAAAPRRLGGSPEQVRADAVILQESDLDRQNRLGRNGTDRLTLDREEG
jgi:hypothetical protein